MKLIPDDDSEEFKMIIIKKNAQHRTSFLEERIPVRAIDKWISGIKIRAIDDMTKLRVLLILTRSLCLPCWLLANVEFIQRVGDYIHYVSQNVGMRSHI